MRFTREWLAEYERKQASRGVRVGSRCIPELLSTVKQPAAPKVPKAPLNKTELRYKAILQATHPVVRSQAIRLQLAERCTYTPDFFTPDDRTFWEVKGSFVREDGWIKLKVAATMYPEFRFIMAQYEGGKWSETEIKRSELA